MLKESNLKHNKISLKGDRVILSSITNSDFNLIKKWFKNPKVIEYIIPDKKNDNFLIKLLTKLFKPTIISKLFKYFINNGFGLIINFNDEAIGVVICWLIDKESKTYRVPITIGNTKYWRKGFGKDTIQTVTKFIFNDLKGNTIIAGDIAKENLRSINMFLSCGFQELSTSQAGYFRNLSIPKKVKKRSVENNREDNTISLILRNDNAE